MPAVSKNVNPLEIVPRLKEGKDWGSISLTPVESFILSRIDGESKIRDIIAVTGLEEEKVISTIRKLLSLDIIVAHGLEPLGDEENGGIDLTPEQIQEIEEFLKKLEKNDYFEILGIHKNASRDEIKDASINIIRRFHPDRFFRKRLGPYKKKLEFIVMRIQTITETLLSDVQIQRKFQEAREETKHDEKKEKPVPGHQKKKPEARRSKEVEKIKERIKKGKEFYREALACEEKGDIENALLNLQLAHAYDPFCKEYIEKIALLKAKKEKGKNWKNLYKEALRALSQGEDSRGERLLTECILQKPDIPDPYKDLASVLMEKGKADRAVEVLKMALSRFENEMELRLILASIYEKQLEYDRALVEMKKILKYLVKSGQIQHEGVKEMVSKREE